MENIFEATVAALHFEYRDVECDCEAEYRAPCLVAAVGAVHSERPTPSVAFHARDALDLAQLLGCNHAVKLHRDGLPRIALLQRRERVVGYDDAFADDDGAVADSLRLLHYVCGEDYGLLPAELLDEVADFDDLVGVETRCRLVEDENLGVVHHCAGYACALTVAFGEFANLLELMLPKSHCVNGIVNGLFCLRPWDVHRRRIFEVFADVHIEVEGVVFGQVADGVFELRAARGDVVAVDEHRAAVCGDAACNYLHRGALARAVWPEEAHHLAAVDAEGDVVYGDVGAVGFREVLYREGHSRALFLQIYTILFSLQIFCAGKLF